mmetsp:Transcript_11370/g.17068  ORF Transcript_11370/g.17068 Transcript_11370/m.17068 type:complete len:137 (-) Transcript_11370:1986-2396(-)
MPQRTGKEIVLFPLIILVLLVLVNEYQIVTGNLLELVSPERNDLVIKNITKQRMLCSIGKIENLTLAASFNLPFRELQLVLVFFSYGQYIFWGDYAAVACGIHVISATIVHQCREGRGIIFAGKFDFQFPSISHAW